MSALTDAERTAAESVRRRFDPPGDPREVIEEVARIFDVAVDDVLRPMPKGGRRTAILVAARDTIAAILAARGWGEEHIGDAVGQRDRATVSQMLMRVRQDPDLCSLARAVAKEVQA